MNWPSPGAIGALALLAAAIYYAVSVEKKITRRELPLVGYSFKQTWRFGKALGVISVLLSLVIYWRTDDVSFALTWLVILLALGAAGVIRGLLSEYHHKQRGGENLDKKRK